MTKVHRKLMTPAEYARHRGCSLQAVRRALKEARITGTAAGLLDPVVADAEWMANTRPRVKPKPAAEPAPDGEHVSYHEARRRRELAQALAAERDLRVRNGELVVAEDAKRLYAAALLAVKESLLGLAPRMGAVLAAETDPAAVERLLYAEVLQCIAAAQAVALETVARERLAPSPSDAPAASTTCARRASRP